MVRVRVKVRVRVRVRVGTSLNVHELAEVRLLVYGIDGEGVLSRGWRDSARVEIRVSGRDDIERI
jgi:hypothetical protein